MEKRPGFWSFWLREQRRWLDEIVGNNRWLRRFVTAWILFLILVFAATVVSYIDKNISAPWYAGQALCQNALVAFGEYTMKKPDAATEDIIDRALIDMIDLCEPYLLQR